MVGLGVGLAVVSLAGCPGGSNGVSVEACERVCECSPGVPAQTDECMDECLEELSIGFEWPPACVDCILEASCAEVDDCGDSCFPPDEEGDGPGGGAADEWEE
ncbi:MAG: hypothetical protein HYY06_13540 [Deltaproteobacteria bacterium]|nr:hypothetical protein [Deltaproteobacteria bacterium]